MTESDNDRRRRKTKSWIGLLCSLAAYQAPSGGVCPLCMRRRFLRVVRSKKCVTLFGTPLELHNVVVVACRESVQRVIGCPGGPTPSSHNTQQSTGGKHCFCSRASLRLAKPVVAAPSRRYRGANLINDRRPRHCFTIFTNTTSPPHTHPIPATSNNYKKKTLLVASQASTPPPRLL